MLLASEDIKQKQNERTAATAAMTTQTLSIAEVYIYNSVHWLNFER